MAKKTPYRHLDLKVLADSEKALTEGKTAVSDWEEAKERIGRKVSSIENP